MMHEGALAGLKVVEYASFISGPYCAKLLGDLGAEVIKIENPDTGDPARTVGPFPNDTPHPERSGLFMYLNAGKRGVAVRDTAPEGMSIIRELVKQADIFIEDAPSSVAAELGLEYPKLKELSPRLVVTSITPFGRTGPYRDHKGSDLVASHMSGLGFATPTRVDNPAEEPPLRLGGRQADYLAGATGAVATMFAIMVRAQTGEGQYVDVSQQEAIASFLRLEIPSYTYNTGDFYQTYLANRKRPGWGPVGYLPCKDGYFAMGCREQYQWRGLMEEILGEDWLLDERLEGVFPEPGTFDLWSLIDNWDRVRPLVVEWTMKHTKEEICQLAKAKNLPLAPCNNVKEVLEWSQLAARGYFNEIDHPEGGRVVFPGALCVLSKTPMRVQGRAPLLGEHTREVLTGTLGYSETDLLRLRDSGAVGTYS